MTSQDIEDTIRIWTDWASNSSEPRYDIALFKIWIQFERFLSDLFVLYATGNKSEKGYSPALKLSFADDSHLNPFLRDGNSKHIDYLKKIESLSQFIFDDDIFGTVVFNDPDYSTVYRQVCCWRNYIAHESGEAKAKVISCIFSGSDSAFCEPNEYLKRKKKGTNITNYTHYTDSIMNMVSLLVQGVTS